MAVKYLGEDNVRLDRDNKFTITLTQDGVPPAQNVITKAALWFPGEAFADGNPKVFDTIGPQLSLIENATKVSVDMGAVDIKEGAYSCFLTIYDAINTNGIGWDKIMIKVVEWPAEV